MTGLDMKVNNIDMTCERPRVVKQAKEATEG